MDKHGIWSTFEAQPGKEADVEVFLRECAARIEHEPGTTAFFALKIGPGHYATFATMHDDTALQTHVAGPTADAVRSKAQELFVHPPAIVQTAILAAKRPGAGEQEATTRLKK